MGDIIVTVIELIVIVAAFLLGKYVWPNISSETISDVTTKVNLVVTYAENFVAWAKQFMSGSTGSEKMAQVVEYLQEICEKYNIDMTEAELQAIAQKAYDAMKAGEASNVTDATNQVLVTIAAENGTSVTSAEAVTEEATTEGE